MTPKFPSRADQKATESEARRVYRHQRQAASGNLDEHTVDAEHDSREIVLRIRLRPRTIITVGIAFAIGLLCGMTMEAQAMHSSIEQRQIGSSSTLDR